MFLTGRHGGGIDEPVGYPGVGGALWSHNNICTRLSTSEAWTHRGKPWLQNFFVLAARVNIDWASPDTTLRLCERMRFHGPARDAEAALSRSPVPPSPLHIMSKGHERSEKALPRSVMLLLCLLD